MAPFEGMGYGPLVREQALLATDENGIAFGRSPQQVLNIVYLQGGTGISSGGFYPKGLNGDLKTS